jgi:CRP-like cAMP-binding protein
MTVEGLDTLMQEHPFFEGLSAEALELLAGCASNERFPAGRTIVREGDSADKFFLIRHGTVAQEIRVPGRDPLIIETLEEGDILGWSWIVPPYRWTFDARALELVRTISLDATCLRAKCEQDHSLGYDLYQRIVPVMSRRLKAVRLRLVDMYAPAPGAGLASARR